MSFSVPAMSDSELMLSAAKERYTIDAVSAPRRCPVAEKSFGNLILLGIRNFISPRVGCIHGLQSQINQSIFYYHIYIIFSYKPHYILFSKKYYSERVSALLKWIH